MHAGHKVRYFTAADLVDTLYRGLADNTVGKIIDTLLRAELIIVDEVGFAPLDDTGTQLLFRLSRPPTNAAHWLWPRIGHSSNGAGSCPSTPPPPASWTTGVEAGSVRPATRMSGHFGELSGCARV